MRRPQPQEHVLFHLLQEYARDVRQLDVVRELIDGTVGSRSRTEGLMWLVVTSRR